MSAKNVRYEVHDAVATITLDRPASLNALNLETARELSRAALLAADNDSVRCIVVTGAGRAFCAGGDVADFSAHKDDVAPLLKEVAATVHAAISTLCRAPKPVLMAVNGPAAGGGMSLALSGDITIASEVARFTMAYAAIGASPDGGSTFFLPRLIGARRALALYLTNRALSAEEALQLGLVDEVHGEAVFAERVSSLASELARGPTSAFGRAKELFLQVGHGLETQMELEARALADSGRTKDFQDAVAAFSRRERFSRFSGT